MFNIHFNIIYIYNITKLIYMDILRCDLILFNNIIKFIWKTNLIVFINLLYFIFIF